MGLSSEILDNAKSLLKKDSAHIEDLMKQIYDDKLLIEKEKEEIKKNSNQIEILRKGLEEKTIELKNKEISIIEKAKHKAQDLLLSAKEDANDIIHELNDLYNNVNSNALKSANKLRNDLNDKLKDIKTHIPNENEINNSISKNDIHIGLEVFVNKFNQNGTVLSNVNKSNEIEVQIGNMKTHVNIKDLSYSKNVQSKDVNVSNYSNRQSKLNTKQVSNELNVIGNNVEEAIWMIDKYLDDCVLSGLTTVRIVHGKGTGKLRDGIHAFLKKNKHVESFRLGTFGEGEMGVTVVQLK